MAYPRLPLLIGNYLLMMFYTVVCGWMLHYFVLMAAGRFEGLDTDGVSAVFPEMLGNPWVLGAWTVVVILAGFAINSLACRAGWNGSQRG